MRNLLVLISIVSLLSASHRLPAEEKPITRQAALERIVSAESVEKEWFATGFLQAVPVEQIHLILTQMRAQFGAYKEVRPDGKNFTTVFEKGVFPTQITLDSEGRVIGLLFQPPRGLAKNLDEVIAGFKALPGKVSVLALENGAVKAELNPDEPLAVGSAFKLVVLAELKRRVAEGKMTWSQVEKLRDEHKSLPSGILQDWPEGSPLTLNTLATLMISISDNTATDHLVRLLGAESLEKISPRNTPFLTTLELFRMKYGPQADALASRYIAADEAGKRALLAEVNALPLPSEEHFRADPVALEIEWFITARELSKLIVEVRGLPLMSINPGPVPNDEWQRIAYKGGSEPGVMCLATTAQTKDGREITAIATWNNLDAVLDENQFYVLYGDLAEQLK